MPDKAFLSYSSKDREFATFLAEAVRANGVDVFIDYQRLVAGDSFPEQIRREVSECDYFILVVTATSAESKWVQAELNLAYSLNKCIIPVILEVITLEHSKFWFLVNREQVSFVGWNAHSDAQVPLKKLIAAMHSPSGNSTNVVAGRAAEGTTVSPKEWLEEYPIVAKFPSVRSIQMLRPVVEGQSGSKVFIVKIYLREANSRPQTCFLKIHYAQGNTPLLRHQEAFETFGRYMPRVIDATPWDAGTNRIALLYSADRTVDNSVSLDDLLETSGLQAHTLIVNTCEAISNWNHPIDFETNYRFLPLFDLIQTAFSHSTDETVKYRRLENEESSIFDRLKDSVGLSASTSQLRVAGKRRILPNPLAYINDRRVWNQPNSKTISWICGHVHGDLNIRNVLSLTGRGEGLSIIDFDTYDPANLIFLDYFQLELGIIIKLLSPREARNHSELIRLSEYLSSDLTLQEIPDLGATSIGINTLIRPIRNKLAEFWQDDEDLISSIWVARLVVGLELSRKQKLHISEKVFSVLYAADSLSSLLRHLRIEPIDNGSTHEIEWPTEDSESKGNVLKGQP